MLTVVMMCVFMGSAIASSHSDEKVIEITKTLKFVDGYSNADLMDNDYLDDKKFEVFNNYPGSNPIVTFTGELNGCILEITFNLNFETGTANISKVWLGRYCNDDYEYEEWYDEEHVMKWYDILVKNKEPFILNIYTKSINERCEK